MRQSTRLAVMAPTPWTLAPATATSLPGGSTRASASPTAKADRRVRSCLSTSETFDPQITQPEHLLVPYQPTFACCFAAVGGSSTAVVAGERLPVVGRGGPRRARARVAP